jgi:hypothetical protein
MSGTMSGVSSNDGWTNPVRFVAVTPHPRGANPFPWPVSGLAKAPLRLPMRGMSRTVANVGTALRTHIEDGSASQACDAFAYRCGGSTGWLGRSGVAPCFPFNCVREERAREHQSAWECRGDVA